MTDLWPADSGPLMDEICWCDGCDFVMDPERLRDCEHCGMQLCPHCWGPKAQDDLYVGWCFECAG